MGTYRCKCCLRSRPVWLEHAGRHYCSFDCAEAWGEATGTPGASLLVAARTQRAREHLAEAAAALARGRSAA